jgi:hypothetical protein
MSGDQRPTRRSNGLGAGMIAVPLMLLAYALLGFAGVELWQFLVEHGADAEPGWIRLARERAAEWSLR